MIYDNGTGIPAEKLKELNERLEVTGRTSAGIYRTV